MSQGIFITSRGSLVSHGSALREDTPASQEGKLLLAGQPPASLAGLERHTLLGSPPPFPGLPWDTDQGNPSPALFQQNFPTASHFPD